MIIQIKYQNIAKKFINSTNVLTIFNEIIMGNTMKLSCLRKNMRSYTILSLCLCSFAFGMDNKEDLVYQTVKKIVEDHTDLVDSSKGKDIIVFLGHTGSGKSTLVNYLSEKKLKVNDIHDIILENSNDSSAMKISIDENSQTFLPEFIQTGDLLFYDLPGFEDTRGISTNLVNACFIKHIIENAESVKLVFVAGIGEISENRAKNLKEFLNVAQELIPNEPIINFSSLIITKSDQSDINKYIQQKVVNMSDKPILESWIENEKIAQMSKPKTKDIDQTERTKILKIINSINSKKISNFNIEVAHDSKTKDSIRNIYKEEISCIVEKFNYNDFSSLEIESLKEKKQYFQNNFIENITSSLNKSPIIKLLSSISADIYDEVIISMQLSSKRDKKVKEIEDMLTIKKLEREKEEEIKKREKAEKEEAKIKEKIHFREDVKFGFERAVDVSKIIGNTVSPIVGAIIKGVIHK